MATVDRMSDGSETKGDRYNRMGIVKYVTLNGAPVNYDSNRRPVGQAQGQPDVDRAEKEVNGNYATKFNAAREKRRDSVYAPKNN